jgi:hypothetical protein
MIIDNVHTEDTTFRDAPEHWATPKPPDESTLHQLSPYIGKLKPRIARDLIEQYSRPGELIIDPFCGSGTIPLEAMLAGRRAFAADDSPYAYTLTKAKLRPPATVTHALRQLSRVLAQSQLRPTPDLRRIPEWVRRFFHPQTLKDAIRFADECLETRNHFLLSCFLGILHHQRPGFLSYPSSHLVPYLRHRKYPKSLFPEMYEARELGPRLAAKIHRAFGSAFLPPLKSNTAIRKSRIEHLTFPVNAGAVITSPPYMNALDYRRDNRLRLWFLDRRIGSYSPEPTDRLSSFKRMMHHLLSQSSHSLRPDGHLVLVIGETITRKRVKSHPSSILLEMIARHGSFSLVDAIRDQIPDIRRSRREYRGTKTEHVLIFRKNS